MSEHLLADRPWSEGHVRRLVLGERLPDAESKDAGGCGWRDSGGSAYELMCAALDCGEGELMLDVIQLEDRIERVEDLQERLALVAACCGWPVERIGAAIRSSRTGRDLVEAGIRSISRQRRL